MRLKERDVAKLPVPETNDKRYPDEGVKGFGVRVTPRGVRSFYLNYSTNGRERRLTVGKWPEWNVTRAREQAKEFRRQIDAGIDPLAEKQQGLKDPTFGQLVGEYLAVEGAKQKGFQAYKRLLEVDALPTWRNIRAADIKRRDVIALIEKKARTAPVTANRLFELIRRVFNFAVRRDILETSPCVQVKRPTKERSRERALNASEIEVFWHCLNNRALFTHQTASALKLMLATAQREGEVCSLRWDELDFDTGWWTLPREKTKSERTHRAPLNATAREVLAALPHASEWVFPSPRTDEPIRPNAVALALRRARTRNEELGKLERFSPHDLRRTAATHMATHGVSEFDIGLVLNHARAGVTQVYNRAAYDDEKRRALDVWDRVLRACIAGKATAAESREVVEFPG